MGHSLDDLALFVDAVRAGGVRAAAKAQGVPRSTVSRRLARLEDALGVRLLQRSTARLQLTEAGQASFERLSRLVDEARELSAELADRGREPRGVLRLATTPIFAEHALPAVTTRYLKEHPKVRVELLASAERVDLLAERIDLAIRSGPPEDSSTLTARRLGSVVLGLFASPAYVRLRGMPRSVAELAEHDLLVASPRSAGARWTLQLRGRPRSVPVTGRVHSETEAYLRRLCERGAGIARAPTYLMTEKLRRGQLVPVLESSWLHAELHMVYPLAPPPRTRAFVALALELLGQAEPWSRRR